MKQAKVLERHLKLCQYAFSLAVHPGMESLQRRERMIGLQTLEKRSKTLPVDLMVDHSQIFATELLASSCAEEWSEATMQSILSMLSIWTGLVPNNSVPEWTAEMPSFSGLLLLVNDRHKLLPQGSEKIETIRADYKA